MSNISIGYLYRDADNFKAFNTVTFSNPGNRTVESVNKVLLVSLSHHQLWADVIQFRPEWVGLPPVFLFLSAYERTEADQDFHEIEEVALTERSADDPQGRTIDEFLNDMIRTHGLRTRLGAV